MRLWGLVSSEAERKALIALAEGVPGVARVVDEMIPTTESALQNSVNPHECSLEVRISRVVSLKFNSTAVRFLGDLWTHPPAQEKFARAAPRAVANQFAAVHARHQGATVIADTASRRLPAAQGRKTNFAGPTTDSRPT